MEIPAPGAMGATGTAKLERVLKWGTIVARKWRDGIDQSTWAITERL
jgi:hypothetical protein